MPVGPVYSPAHGLAPSLAIEHVLGMFISVNIQCCPCPARLESSSSVCILTMHVVEAMLADPMQPSVFHYDGEAPAGAESLSEDPRAPCANAARPHLTEDGLCGLPMGRLAGFLDRHKSHPHAVATPLGNVGHQGQPHCHVLHPHLPHTMQSRLRWMLSWTDNLYLAATTI